MKSRNEEAVLVELEVNEALLSYQLPTLALQLVVENCFKHNSMTSKKPLRIAIKGLENLYIQVCNNIQPKLGESETSGKGLELLRKRYELMDIEDGIIVKETKEQFCVKLKLI
jgi:LytS/YehU family sensor histidine kinase